jgi:DNA-binding Lrp family transcriptional regulator
MFSTRDKIILRELSANSRVSLLKLSKMLGCSYVTIGKIIRKLNEELDIKYVLELDFEKLGFQQMHILLVKFNMKISKDQIKKLVKDDNSIIAAYLTQGQYNMVVIAAENNPINYLLWEFGFIQRITEFNGEIKSSDMPYFIFGYVPIENILINKIKIKIKDNELQLLKLLNENSRISYSELSRKLKLNESTIRYKVFKLTKLGIIKRFTIAVQKPPQLYILSMFENWFSFSKNFEEEANKERKHMLTIDDNTNDKIKILTTIQIAAPLCGSYGNFIMALFDSKTDAINNMIKPHYEFYKKEKYIEKHAQILEAVKGFLPLRNLDIKENYKVIKWVV